MYVKADNRKKCWITTKVVYFCYILYWAWGLEAFPQIGGYLIPLGMLMAGITMANYFVARQPLDLLLPFSIKMWLFFGFTECIISVLIVTNSTIAIEQLKIFIEIIFVLVCLMAISILDNGISFVVNISKLVYLIYAISMMFLAENRDGRLTLYNSNADAMVCLAGIVLTFFSIKLEKHYRTILEFGIICFFFYCIIQTGSRKAMICASLFILLWMLATARMINRSSRKAKENNRHFFNFVFIVFIIVSLTVGVSLITSSYAFQKILSGGDEMSDGYRVLLYQEAWYFFRTNPIFGVGYGLFRNMSSIGRMSHSTYAEMLACCGLYGSIVYFSPYLYIAKNLLLRVRQYMTFRNKMRCLTLCIHFIIMLFLGMGMVHFYNEKFMMMFGIMTAFIEIECRKENSTDICLERKHICSFIREH